MFTLNSNKVVWKLLIGEYSCSLDAKGRVNFPSKLRDDLGGHFILAKGLGDDCLYVYSVVEWQNVEQKIKTLPLSKARNLQRFLFASANEVEPDKQGRIVIPANLREYAKLEKDAIIIGVSTHCEIWSAAEWDRVCNDLDSATISKALDELLL